MYLVLVDGAVYGGKLLKDYPHVSNMNDPLFDELVSTYGEDTLLTAIMNIGAPTPVITAIRERMMEAKLVHNTEGNKFFDPQTGEPINLPPGFFVGIEVDAWVKELRARINRRAN